MDSDWAPLSAVHYYIRERFYGTALARCEERIRERPDTILTLHKALLLVLYDRVPEGMRQLEPLRSHPQMGIGALQALKIAHNKATNPDRESLREIEADISKVSKNADDEANYTAAEVLYLTGSPQKARPYAERALSGSPDNAKYLCLFGWIEFALGRDTKGAYRYFETAMTAHFPDAFIGKGRMLEQRHAAGEMRQVARDLAGQLVSFVPAHLEAARATVLAREWESAAQLLQNALVIQSDNVVVHWQLAVYAVVFKGSGLDTALTDLWACIDASEAKNHAMMADFANFFLKVAVGNQSVLGYARRLLEKALAAKRSPEYVAHVLRLLLQTEDSKEAMGRAKELLEDGAQGTDEILGIARCYLAEGKANDASSQLNFIKETHPDIVKSPMYMYLMALVARFKENSFDRFFAGLKNAIDTHLSTLHAIPYGIEYIKALDPVFLYSCATQLYDFAPLMPTKTPDTTLKELERILTFIHDHCPGLTQATYLLAKVKYLCTDSEGADKLLDEALDKDETMADAYLLRAQIKVDKFKIEEADRCLDTGLSFNFKVRESTLYYLIKARVLKRRGEDEKAVDLLRSALQLPSKEKAHENFLIRKEKEDSDRIAIYLQLIDSLQSLKRTTEADTVMQQALASWKGKPEEEQLLLMNAQLHVSKGDPDAALAILAKVQPNQPNYQAARTKMAEIYLEEKKDKRMFTICYKLVFTEDQLLFRELLERDPSPATYAMLGDAYMSVQNPNKAIEVYEKALKANPKDHLLAEKIGQAYVQCHLYAKAVNYYEAAVKTAKDSSMRLKLAELLFNIKNYEKCERILREPLDKDPNPIDTVTMHSHVQCWMLLSKLHFENGNWQEAIEDLTKAKSIQLRVLQKGDGGGNIQQKKLASQICCKLAELHSNRRETNKAIDLYKEALGHNETDVKIILALAQIYMSTGKLHLCNQQCQIALSIDRNNDEATLMMADLLYMKNEGEAAIKHFTQLLDRYPNDYHALARVIELGWRTGAVEVADTYLKKAIENNPRCSIDAGFNFCKGLHEWCSGEWNVALQAFNRARRDLEWGERAIYNMIEICLNPDNEIIGGEVLQSDEIGENDAQEREMGTKTAEMFLKELRFKPGVDTRYALMENYILVASGNKMNIQHALNQFTEMIGNEEKVSSVGAVLGAARAYMLLRQTPKAKAILKRVISHPWTLEDADSLEKCWLLLADLYINQSKTEQATKVIETILQHNASCIKAFEYMGLLHEKEQKWIDAAANYEQAWRLSKRRNPQIGYKLAYNYLRSKKLFQCIEVCQKVLQQYPTYPKIRKEIMEKARSNLRT